MSTPEEEPVRIDPTSPLGYARNPALQRQFEDAAKVLLEHDGWPNPAHDDRPELWADLALEGGGVKGIALVGAVLALTEAGYHFRAVAGTSAGAIAASLIAALTQADAEMAQLKTIMDTLDFSEFMPEGRIHEFLDRHGAKVLVDVAVLAQRMGLYSGDYLIEWLLPQIEQLGVTTFGDLKLTPAEDPGMSLPAGHNYRLLVHTADITRKQLVRLPWDYPIYGHEQDPRQIVHAVRASMSIPFFFEPVTFEANPARVPVPQPGGGTVTQVYPGGEVTWVDGGMLRNFPIYAFDRVDGNPSRWPTIGIKLSALQTAFRPDEACANTPEEGVHCVHTLMNEWDTYSVDEATAARTIFVDNGGINATEFDLTQAQQDMLFCNGVAAATEFVIEMAPTGVPRNAVEAWQRVMAARARANSSG